jgi:hypothetical protein
MMFVSGYMVLCKESGYSTEVPQWHYINVITHDLQRHNVNSP